ncbi:MAG: condensation domain-containing protein, partial [Actinocatenispora sp.]
EIDGPIDPARLDEAVRTVQQGHELLRAGFLARGDDLDVVPTTVPSTLAVTTVPTGVFADRDALNEAVMRPYQEPFALDGTPLVRVDLLTDGGQRNVLLVTMHRLVCDLQSNWVVVEDLARAYAGAAVEFGHTSYFTAMSADEARLAGDRTYWADALADYPVVQLGDRRPDGEWQPDGRRVEIAAPGLGDALTTGSAARRATPFVLVTAAVLGTLAEAYGTGDLCCATASENRLGAGLRRTIGPLAQTVLLRLRGADQRYGDVVREVKTVFRDALRHQRLPFEEVVGLLTDGGVDRDMIAPVVLAVETPRAPLTEFAGLPAREFLGAGLPQIVVRPGEASFQFVLDPDAPTVTVTYDGAFLSDEHVRALVDGCLRRITVP